jgi:foldase protein PrsA
MGSAKKRVLALGAFFVVAVGVAGCGGGVPGDSVAVMAGNPITTQAFDHWMYIAAKGQASQAPGTPVIVPDPPDYKNCIASARTISALAATPETTLKSDCALLFTQLSQQVLGYLIPTYWYQAEAHQKGITVSNAEVLKTFNTAKDQQFPGGVGFQAFLASTGQTLQDIYYRIRFNALEMKLIAKQSATITAAQIQNYYNSHQSTFGTPESLDLRLVLTKDQATAQTALTALKAGATWKAIAAKYSIDTTTKSNGGQLVGMTQGSEDSALTNAAFAAPVQTFEGPVKGQFGYYIFKVTGKKPGTSESLAQASPQIKQILTQTQSTTAQAAVAAQVKKNWMPKTECRSGYEVPQCSNYKAPKTTTSTTPTPTVTAPATTSTGTATTGTTTTKK